MDHGSYWRFAGHPTAACFKEVSKRPMTVEEYRAVLASGEKGVKLDGFVSGKGKAYSARVTYVPTQVKEKESPFRFAFDD